METQPPPHKVGAAPSSIFGRFLLWPSGWMHQDAIWHGGRPRPTRHCVRCGPSYPQKKRLNHPQPILAHVYCGQMAGWMKTPLGMGVDRGPGHIVLDGLPALAKGAQQPHGRPSQLLLNSFYLPQSRFEKHVNLFKTKCLWYFAYFCPVLLS